MSPFRSTAQRKFLWAKHPDIARRWTEKYGPKIKKKSAKERYAEMLKK